jgi:hypothetical protein
MKISRTISILALMIATFSCSPVKVVVDSNKKVDFSVYKTYNFQNWQDVSDEIFSEGDKKLMRDAFISEFTRRGLKQVNSTGDMQVSLYLVTNAETAFSGYSDYVGGRNSGYDHYGGGWGYGYNGNTSKQQGKLVGTLIMNVYDNNGKNQIWQAIATSTVNENPKTDRTKTIPGKVSIIMKNFPVPPQ